MISSIRPGWLDGLHGPGGEPTDYGELSRLRGRGARAHPVTGVTSSSWTTSRPTKGPDLGPDHRRLGQGAFLPAYSPDLNPIEKMWSKVKSLLRGAEARTPADLIAAIGQALARVTAQDALGWFASCSYSFC